MLRLLILLKSPPLRSTSKYNLGALLALAEIQLIS